MFSEVDWLITNGHLGKTIFVLPPGITFWETVPKNSQLSDAKGAWDAIKGEMVRRAIAFPDYDKRGLLFGIGKDGTGLVTTKLTESIEAPGLARRIAAHRKLMGL